MWSVLWVNTHFPSRQPLYMLLYIPLSPASPIATGARGATWEAPGHGKRIPYADPEEIGSEGSGAVLVRRGRVLAMQCVLDALVGPSRSASTGDRYLVYGPPLGLNDQAVALRNALA